MKHFAFTILGLLILAPNVAAYSTPEEVFGNLDSIVERMKPLEERAIPTAPSEPTEPNQPTEVTQPTEPAFPLPLPKDIEPLVEHSSAPEPAGVSPVTIVFGGMGIIVVLFIVGAGAMAIRKR